MIKKPQPKSSIYRELAPYTSLSYQLIASAALLGAIGWQLDNKFGTRPLWLAIGLGAGCIIGLTTFILSVLKADKKPPDQK